MRLLDVAPLFDAGELHKETSTEVGVVVRPRNIIGIHYAELDHLGVSHEIECEKVGPRLLDGAAVGPEIIKGDARPHLPRHSWS